jgi:hypothetical protein
MLLFSIQDASANVVYSRSQHNQSKKAHRNGYAPLQCYESWLAIEDETDVARNC